MKTALVDGDEIAYKVALQYQDTVYVVHRNMNRKYICPNKQMAIDSIGSDESLDILPEIKDQRIDRRRR